MAARSRVKFGGPDNEQGRDLDALKEAVRKDCQNQCLEHFGKVPDLGFLQIDLVRQDEAFERARAQRKRANPYFRSILRDAEEVQERAEKGLVSEEAAEVAREIAVLAGGILSGFEIEPGRTDWLRRVRRFFDLDGIPLETVPLDVLTAISLLAGFWPEPITEAYLLGNVIELGEDPEGARSVTPANVFGRERKAIRKALRDIETRELGLVADPVIQKIAKWKLRPHQ